MHYKLICIIFLLIITPDSIAQKISVVRNINQYQQKAKKDSSFKMVELKQTNPSIVYDLKYATKDNFTQQQLYKNGTSTFLRLEAANALNRVQEELKLKGVGLKIYDAYRPYSVTKKMWDLIGDERYVANPAKGSGHNRGISVDLTIIALSTGKELDMGTVFDNFTDTAHHNFTQLAPTVLQNRKLLRQIMEKHGFKAYETEWWHYSWSNNKNFDVLDIDFRKLLKTCY